MHAREWHTSCHENAGAKSLEDNKMRREN